MPNLSCADLLKANGISGPDGSPPEDAPLLFKRIMVRLGEAQLGDRPYVGAEVKPFLLAG